MKLCVFRQNYKQSPRLLRELRKLPIEVVDVSTINHIKLSFVTSEPGLNEVYAKGVPLSSFDRILILGWPNPIVETNDDETKREKEAVKYQEWIACLNSAVYPFEQNVLNSYFWFHYPASLNTQAGRRRLLSHMGWSIAATNCEFALGEDAQSPKESHEPLCIVLSTQTQAFHPFSDVTFGAIDDQLHAVIRCTQLFMVNVGIDFLVVTVGPRGNVVIAEDFSVDVPECLCAPDLAEFLNDLVF